MLMSGGMKKFYDVFSIAKEKVFMVKAADIGSLIDLTPDIRGGRPRISGTGVTVRRIVEWYKLGLSPEEIAHEVGHITLAQVFAALAYYHANREEIEADLANEKDIADQLEAAQGGADQKDS